MPVAGAVTFSTRSAEPRSAAGSDKTATPTSRYAESGKPAASPAPDSIAMSYPIWINFLHDSGTRATRRSPGADSLGTAIRIQTPATDEHSTPQNGERLSAIDLTSARGDRALENTAERAGLFWGKVGIWLWPERRPFRLRRRTFGASCSRRRGGPRPWASSRRTP